MKLDRSCVALGPDRGDAAQHVGRGLVARRRGRSARRRSRRCRRAGSTDRRSRARPGPKCTSSPARRPARRPSRIHDHHDGDCALHNALPVRPMRISLTVHPGRRRAASSHAAACSAVQPGVEETVELAPGDPLGQRDELLRSSRCRRRSRSSSPSAAGRTPRRRSAGAARAGSSRRGRRPAGRKVRRPGVADLDLPERGRPPGSRRRWSKRCLRRPAALALGPQPLGVGGEALVEPDVAPAARPTRGRRPTGARARGRSPCPPRGRAVLEEHARVDRAGLVLQREAE